MKYSQFLGVARKAEGFTELQKCFVNYGELKEIVMKLEILLGESVVDSELERALRSQFMDGLKTDMEKIDEVAHHLMQKLNEDLAKIGGRSEPDVIGNKDQSGCVVDIDVRTSRSTCDTDGKGKSEMDVLHQKAQLVKQYCELNAEALRKISKKYDRRAKGVNEQERVIAELKTRAFGDQRIERIVERIQQQFDSQGYTPPDNEISRLLHEAGTNIGSTEAMDVGSLQRVYKFLQILGNMITVQGPDDLAATIKLLELDAGETQIIEKFGEHLEKVKNNSILPPLAYMNYGELEAALRRGSEDEFFKLLEAQTNQVRTEIASQVKQVSRKGLGSFEVGAITIRISYNNKTSKEFVDALYECVEVAREACRHIMDEHDQKYPNRPPRQLEKLNTFDSIMEDTIDSIESFGPMARFKTNSKSGVYKAGILSVVLVGMAVYFVAMSSSRLVICFGLGLVFAFLTAIGNAANDICNAVGTCVGCGALTLSQAVFGGCLFEAIGCLTLGPFVSKSITKGMLENDVFKETPDLFAFSMLCVLIGEPCITLLATAYGFPISATHGIIGGIVAVGLAAKGPDAIGWTRLGLVASSWVIAPLAGALIALSMHLLIQLTVFKGTLKNAPKRAMLLQPFFLWICASVNILFIFLKGPSDVRIKVVWKAVAMASGLGLAVTCVAGPLIMFKRKRRAWVPAMPACWNKIVSALGLDEDIMAEQKTLGRQFSFRTYALKDAEATSSDVLEAESRFVPLLVISAFSVACAHGGNDVGNAVGPLTAILAIYETGDVKLKHEPPWWAILYGTLGFIVGIIFMGRHTIKTVGAKITTLSPSTAFSTQMGGAVAVLMASSYGMPVSTSHCLIGAVVGVGVAQKLAGKGRINPQVLVRIFIAWVVTIPAASAVAIFVFVCFRSYYL